MHSADYDVACWYFVKTAKHIVNAFHLRVARTFQFFHTKRDGNTLTGTPNWGVKIQMHGAMKNNNFRPISRFSSEMMHHAR